MFRYIALISLLSSCSTARKYTFGELDSNAIDVRFSKVMDNQLCSKIGNVKVKNFSIDHPHLGYLENNLKNEASLKNANVVTNVWKPTRYTGWSFRRYVRADIYQCPQDVIQGMAKKIKPEWIVFGE